MLEQNIIRKKRVDKRMPELEFESGTNKEYEVETIWDSAVYANEVKGHLPGLYYMIA